MTALSIGVGGAHVVLLFLLVNDRNESKLDECVLQQSVSQIGLDLQIHDRVIVQELQEFGSLWFLLQDLQQMQNNSMTCKDQARIQERYASKIFMNDGLLLRKVLSWVGCDTHRVDPFS